MENLKDRLIRCERAVQSAKPILALHTFSADLRTRTVIGFIAALLELQESILLLLDHGMSGAASALSRPVVEGAYRALWICLPATDAEVQRFIENDEIALGFGAIATALDSEYGSGDLFQGFKKLTWNHLNSYTHEGTHQIGRRLVAQNFESNYSEEEIFQFATTVTTIVLIVISVFLQAHGHMDSVDQIQALVETHGLLA